MLSQLWLLTFMFLVTWPIKAAAMAIEKMTDISQGNGIYFPWKSMQRIWHQSPTDEEGKAEWKQGFILGAASFKEYTKPDIW